MPPGSALFTYLNTPLAGNPAGSGNVADDFRVKTNAFAVFTHNRINITDNVALTLGARWNHETKDLSSTINNNTPACAFFYSTDPRAATLRQLYQGASAALYNNLFLLSCNPQINSAINGSYTDDRSEDRSFAVEDSDVVIVPRGYHPVCVPYGYRSYYLNVMAGPKRVWSFRNDPRHEWMLAR